MSRLTLRPLMPEDAESSRTLLQECLAGTPHLARHLEQLEGALRFEDPEFMALLADAHAEDGRLAGLLLFGTVAGARSVVKLHGGVAREERALGPLVEAVREACIRSGERLVVAELPDESPFAALSDALRRGGFEEEGRVPNFVRDGVSLRLLVWRPAATSRSTRM